MWLCFIGLCFNAATHLDGLFVCPFDAAFMLMVHDMVAYEMSYDGIDRKTWIRRRENLSRPHTLPP